MKIQDQETTDTRYCSNTEASLAEKPFLSEKGAKVLSPKKVRNLQNMINARI
jgi:hypothetical protein